MAEKWKDTVNITLRPYGNLYLEEERVKTYVHWPIDTQAFVMTMACAKTGFFYTGKVVRMSLFKSPQKFHVRHQSL